MKVQYLILINHEEDNYVSLRNFIDEVSEHNPMEFEKICLISMVVLESIFEYNSKDLTGHKDTQFIEYLIKKIQMFEETVEWLPDSGYNWEYKNKKRELIAQVLNMNEEFVQNKKSSEKWLIGDFRIKGYGSHISKDKESICCFCRCTQYNYVNISLIQQSSNPKLQKLSDKRMIKCCRCSH